MGNIFNWIEVMSESATATHKVVVATHKVGEQNLTIELRKAIRLGEYGDYLPTQVKDETGKVLWRFQEENFKGLGKLFKVGDELVIGFVGGKNLYKVLPLTDLPKSVVAKIRDQVTRLGGRNVIELLALKHRLAQQEKFYPLLTSEEKAVSAQVRDLEKEIDEEKRVENEKQRAERQMILVARPKVTAYTQDGKKVYGLPMTQQEYPVLPDDTPVIQVESYDDQTGLIGAPVRAFFLRKSHGGRISELGVKTDLTFNPPITQQTEAAPVNILEYRAFRFRNDVVTAPVVGKEDFKAVKGMLNSGSVVAVKTNKKYIVYTLKDGRVDTLGEAPID